MDPMPILASVAASIKKTLAGDLTGIYVHGSIAMGCFTARSDIDFLCVANNPLTFAQKRGIAECLAALSGLPEKGIEMSIILKDHAASFRHPMPFELHYSPQHRQRYIDDPSYVCGGAVDRDLAAHMVVTKLRGIRIEGDPIDRAFGPIPIDDYIDSIMYDVEDAADAIMKDKAYMALSLCRVLQFLLNGDVASKLESGAWAKEYLPPEDAEIAKAALEEYVEGRLLSGFSDGRLVVFAEGMLKRIEEARRSMRPLFDFL